MVELFTSCRRTGPPFPRFSIRPAFAWRHLMWGSAVGKWKAGKITGRRQNQRKRMMECHWSALGRPELGSDLPRWERQRAWLRSKVCKEGRMDENSLSPGWEAAWSQRKAQAMQSGRSGFGPSLTISMTLGCSQLPYWLNWGNNLERINQRWNAV